MTLPRTSATSTAGSSPSQAATGSVRHSATPRTPGASLPPHSLTFISPERHDRPP